MVVSFIPVKGLLRKVLAVALVGATLASAGPAFAAPLRASLPTTLPSGDGSSADMSPFRSDPPVCPDGSPPRAVPGGHGVSCPKGQNSSLSSNVKGIHRPGSSAFGLQFDTGDF
jgi:hypothetical protein